MMSALRLGGVHQMTGFKKLLPGLIRYRSVLLGAILVALVWMSLFLFLNNEHDSAERAAIQNSTNLAGAFEEHLSRSLGEVDRSLIAVRTLYARSAGKFDLTNWLKSSRSAATLTLARSLDIATTAEGVETVEQYRLLRLAGVTSLQGYLFQRPSPSAQLDFGRTYKFPEIENAA
jgi:EAL domain